MTETAHTPGPWEITGISQQTGSVSVGQRDLRIVIADVTNAASFGDMLVGAMKRGGGTFDHGDAKTQFANARLIAAAPAMLAALKAMLANPDKASREQARAAISAATPKEG